MKTLKLVLVLDSQSPSKNTWMINSLKKLCTWHYRVYIDVCIYGKKDGKSCAAVSFSGNTHGKYFMFFQSHIYTIRSAPGLTRQPCIMTLFLWSTVQIPKEARIFYTRSRGMQNVIYNILFSSFHVFYRNIIYW